MANSTKATTYKEPGGFQRFVIDVGAMARFGLYFFKEVFVPPYEFREFLNQCYTLGLKSLFIVSTTGFIMGLVLTMQSEPTLKEFGAEAMLPGMVAISIYREIGPIITALICAGRIGSAIGAELGSMKVTEQIDAMEVSGTYPYHFLVVTRILACIVMLPILTFYTNIMGLLGGYVGNNINNSVSLQFYFYTAFQSIEFSDMVPSSIKTLFFGYIIGLVSCYKGFNTENGTEGVGRSANTSVVTSMLLIFVIDLIAVQASALITVFKNL